jgi:hypothetical protein
VIGKNTELFNSALWNPSEAGPGIDVLKENNALILA